LGFQAYLKFWDKPCQEEPSIRRGGGDKKQRSANRTTRAPTTLLNDFFITFAYSSHFSFIPVVHQFYI
jgi:hypothetical protein